MREKERIQLNVAVTHFAKLDRPRKIRSVSPSNMSVGEEGYILEDEKELCQFYLSLKKFPVDKNSIEAAFRDLKRMVVHECIKLGVLE